MANKAFKFRMYPTEEQKVLLSKTFGCVRLIYNFFLNKRINTYQAVKKSLSYDFCSSYLTFLKKTEEMAFLSEVDSIALQQTLKNLEQAYKSFFEKRTGFPKFKTKHCHKYSYKTININNCIKIDNGRIKLPKLGFAELKQHRNIPSDYKLKSATVSMTPTGKYYVSVLFEYENQVQEVTSKTFLGLDFSMHELYVDSNGQTASYPKYYRKAEAKLAREQRKLANMDKDSRNYQKQRIKVASVHEKIANQRKDFLHKQSRQIANTYDCVCVENLNMQAMSKSLNFGKSIHDNGWGMFTTFLQYKLAEQGKRLVKIDKFFASSQICNKCGHKNSQTKDLSVREWNCPNCGAHHDRDVNAAINIREEGKRMALASA